MTIKPYLFTFIFFLITAETYAQTDTLPAYQLISPENKVYQLNALKGKPIFIYIWRSYEPSIPDMTFLDWLEKQYGDRVQFIYLNQGYFTNSWTQMFNRFHWLKGLQLSTDSKDKTYWEDFLDHYSSLILAGKDGVLYYQNKYQFEEALNKLLQQ